MSLFGQRGRYLLNKTGNECAGFSLLETLIAIAVLTAAVLGPLALSSRSIRYVETSRNNLIASNLAQEGLELVKNIRFNNIINGRQWDRDLTTCRTSPNGCFIYPVDLRVRNCSSNCRFLNFDSSLHLYNYRSGSETNFRRVITIRDINNDEMRIMSSMLWRDKFGNHNFTLETSLLNW